jgi:hypothetical protein
MPTTGSGKILKTELRKMFAGASGSSTIAAAAAPAAAVEAALEAPVEAPAPAASLAEAAAVLAAAAGSGISCQALDAGLGTEWGRELLPDLTYLLVVDRAAAIQSQASSHSPGQPSFGMHTASTCVMTTRTCSIHLKAVLLCYAAGGGSCERQGAAQPGSCQHAEASA